MAEVRDKGVNFKNSHSLFPTFTMANGSAMASGHYLGDTGTFSNTIYTGKPVASANGTVTPFIEVDPVLKEVDEQFGGDYLTEETILQTARAKGGLPTTTVPRGDNSKAGDAKTPGTTVANVAQQQYMADVATKVVLPMFKARNKPFVLVFWSRDPDGSQHNTGDSLNTITPGINGPTD